MKQGRKAVPRRGSRWNAAVGRLGLACLLGCSPGLIGCRPFLGTTAASLMKHVGSDPDPNIRYAAYEKLGNDSVYDTDAQKVEAVRLLVDALKGDREPAGTRAMICRTLARIGHPDARPVLIQRVNDPEPLVRVEAIRALGALAQPEDATILARAMTVDTQADCRTAAIEALGTMRTNDLRVIGMLVDAMDHEDPAIRLSAVEALRAIRGDDLGLETEPWRQWHQTLAQGQPSGGPAPRMQ